MRRSLLLSTAALAGALGLGCDDRPGINDPSTGAAPSFGAEITRTEQPFIFDQANGEILALFGVSFEELPAFCAGADPQELADAMIVSHPTRDGGTVEHVLIKGTELSATVWVADLGPGGDFCDLQGVQPLAVGTVHVTLNDNDGQFFETGSGANAFSIRVGAH
jgi:hypothetical protein